MERNRLSFVFNAWLEIVYQIPHLVIVTEAISLVQWDVVFVDQDDYLLIKVPVKEF